MNLFLEEPFITKQCKKLNIKLAKFQMTTHGKISYRSRDALVSLYLRSTMCAREARARIAVAHANYTPREV